LPEECRESPTPCTEDVMITDTLSLCSSLSGCPQEWCQSLALCKVGARLRTFAFIELGWSPRIRKAKEQQQQCEVSLMGGSQASWGTLRGLPSDSKIRSLSMSRMQ
jgi:hypothetical protein